MISEPDAPPLPVLDTLTSSATTRLSSTSATTTPLITAVNTAADTLPNSDATCTDGARPLDCFPSTGTSAAGADSSSSPDVTRTTSAAGARHSARFPSTEAATAGVPDVSAPYVPDATQTTTFQQLLQLHNALEQQLRTPTDGMEQQLHTPTDELERFRDDPSSSAPNRGASDDDESDLDDLNSDAERQSHQV